MEGFAVTVCSPEVTAFRTEPPAKVEPRSNISVPAFTLGATPTVRVEVVVVLTKFAVMLPPPRMVASVSTAVGEKEIALGLFVDQFVKTQPSDGTAAKP